ncbi:MAG: hypothetical protein ABFR63_05715 [Thermodesulfobacteriota bacterium]
MSDLVSEKEMVLPELSCVAVLPAAVPVSSSENLSSERKKSLLDGAGYLDSVLLGEVGSRPQFQLISEKQLSAILTDPWGGRARQIRDIGQATGCGGVLETTLSRYRQRVGSTKAVDSPASAAFSMELISVESGVVLWTSSYDETQQALTENIFSFGKAQQRGFRWLSVEELASSGMKHSLEGFPYFQEADGQ